MNERARQLAAFIDASPSPAHAVAVAADQLAAAEYRPVALTDPWDPTPGGRFLARGGALLAWHVPEAAAATDGFRIVGAHTDSPTLVVKPRPDRQVGAWRQVGVEVYGSPLLNSWLDRDLSVAGTLVLRDGRSVLVKVSQAVLRIPQLAIHLDRDVNDRGLVLDRQLHLPPVLGVGAGAGLLEVVSAEAGVEPDEIVTFDLRLFDTSPAAFIGAEGELLASGRLDNLCSSFGAIQALLAADRSAAAIPVVALFDHEEVGSESTTGAMGPLLEQVLTRIVGGLGGGAEQLQQAFARSWCLSLDMAHAVHPNYPERHDPAHLPVPNAGVALKVNSSQRYATSAAGAARFHAAAEVAGVPTQVFVSRSSMPCGSTIGPMTAARLGIDTTDAGCPQLSMHSARELMGAADVAHLVELTTAWFGLS